MSTKPTNTPAQTALPEKLNLTDERKKEFFLSLANKSYTDAARQLGLQEFYTTDNSLRTIAYKLYKQIDPRTLGVSEDAISIVHASIADRQGRASKEVTDGATPELLDPEDSKMLVIGGKNKAAVLLHKKFDRLMKNKKFLDEVSLSQLATTFGILFDKSQILKGEATENIAVMAKVDPNMTPEQSLEALLRMREIQQEEKHG
jgi:hypothetical protein